MDHLHAIALALLQGFTEFLPISSSAHLILLPRLLGFAIVLVGRQPCTNDGSGFGEIAHRNHRQA